MATSYSPNPGGNSQVGRAFSDATYSRSSEHQSLDEKRNTMEALFNKASYISMPHVGGPALPPTMPYNSGQNFVAEGGHPGVSGSVPSAAQPQSQYAAPYNGQNFATKGSSPGISGSADGRTTTDRDLSNENSSAQNDNNKPCIDNMDYKMLANLAGADVYSDELLEKMKQIKSLEERLNNTENSSARDAMTSQLDSYKSAFERDAKQELHDGIDSLSNDDILEYAHKNSTANEEYKKSYDNIKGCVTTNG